MNPAWPDDLHGPPAEVARSDEVLHRIIGYIDECRWRQTVMRLYVFKPAPMRLPVTAPPLARADDRHDIASVEAKGGNLRLLATEFAVREHGQCAAGSLARQKSRRIGLQPDIGAKIGRAHV